MNGKNSQYRCGNCSFFDSITVDGSQAFCMYLQKSISNNTKICRNFEFITDTARLARMNSNALQRATIKKAEKNNRKNLILKIIEIVLLLILILVVAYFGYKQLELLLPK
jgi:hypothetical protein